MTKHQKLVVIGMGSKNDQKAFENLMIDGKTIDDYFNSNDIKVYKHPLTKNNLVSSIHRTTENAVAYAKDMRRLVDQGHRLACALYGGLAFAMPGAVAAEAYNVPVFAVGADRDAFFNLYRIPDGTAVGAVGVNKLETGLRLARNMLNLESLAPYRFIVEGSCKSADDVIKQTDEMGFKIPRVEEYNADRYKGVTICLTDNPNYLIQLDKRVEFGIFGLEKEVDTDDALMIAKELQNSVIIGRPKNLGLYAARIMAGSVPRISDRLGSLRAGEQKVYPKRVEIEIGHFK